MLKHRCAAGLSLILLSALPACTPQDEPREQAPALRSGSRLNRQEYTAVRYWGPFTSAGMDLCVNRIGPAYRANAAWPGPNDPVRFAGLDNNTGLSFPDNAWVNEFLNRLGARWTTRIATTTTQSATQPAATRLLRLVLSRFPNRSEPVRTGWERLTLDVLLTEANGNPVWNFRYSFWLDTSALRRSASQYRETSPASGSERRPAAGSPPSANKSDVPKPPKVAPEVPRSTPGPAGPTARAADPLPGSPADGKPSNDERNEPGVWRGSTGWSYLLDPALEGNVQVVAQRGEKNAGRFVVEVTLVNNSPKPLMVRTFITILDNELRFVDETPRLNYQLEPNTPFILRIESPAPGAARYACGIDSVAK